MRIRERGTEGDAALALYILPQARGSGIGRRLLDRCLDEAPALGFTRCYLATLTGLDAAMHLYETAGFRRIEGPMGTTGHFGCDQWYVLGLEGSD